VIAVMPHIWLFVAFAIIPMPCFPVCALTLSVAIKDSPAASATNTSTGLTAIAAYHMLALLVTALLLIVRSLLFV